MTFNQLRAAIRIWRPLVVRPPLTLALLSAFSVIAATVPGAGGVRSTAPQRELEVLRQQLSASDAEDRRDAALSLGALKLPKASRLAAAALGDARPIVRATAARAVLALPPEEAAALLLPLLKDRDDFVRREAAYALGETQSKTATSSLIAVLGQDKQPGVRGAAAVALGHIRDPAATQALITVVARRRPGRGLNRLIFRKEEENEFVRRSAAAALGHLGSREAVPVLMTVLGNERAGDDVRREARALGLIGDQSSATMLRAALRARDPYLARIAREALINLEAAQARSLK
ncbi:MAG: HEAT repeat domain-containing protein [Pyrinomonadaceae bacterium]